MWELERQTWEVDFQICSSREQQNRHSIARSICDQWKWRRRLTLIMVQSRDLEKCRIRFKTELLTLLEARPSTPLSKSQCGETTRCARHAGVHRRNVYGQVAWFFGCWFRATCTGSVSRSPDFFVWYRPTTLWRAPTDLNVHHEQQAPPRQLCRLLAQEKTHIYRWNVL